MSDGAHIPAARPLGPMVTVTIGAMLSIVFGGIACYYKYVSDLGRHRAAVGMQLGQRPTSPELVPTTVGTYWIYGTQEQECDDGKWIDLTIGKEKHTVVDSLDFDNVRGSLIEHREMLAPVCKKFPLALAADNDRFSELPAGLLQRQLPATSSKHQEQWTDNATEYSIRLIFDNKRYYEQSSQSSIDQSLNEWKALKREIASGHRPAEPNEADLQIKVPASAGSTWCVDPESPAEIKSEGWYCWRVDKTFRLPASTKIAKFCLPKETTDYRLVFMTNPDETLCQFISGLGVASREYHHHGSLINTCEQLEEFHTEKAE